jgi:endonuclease/exonuclease/phosphatase family metal-dependent hydrolase
MPELDADIVAFQELLDVQNGRPEFNQARQINSKLMGYEWCYGENRRLHGGAYGNVTLSRLSGAGLPKLQRDVA